MKLAHSLSLIFFLVFHISFSQSKQFNLLFDAGSVEKCTVSIEGKGYQALPKFRKNEVGDIIYFHICKKAFTFMKNEFEEISVSEREMQSVKFNTVEEISRETVMGKNVDIYIYEKMYDSSFCKYRVGFAHDFVYVE